MTDILRPGDGETATPKRIQRRRTKGWRMPEGAVYVGRPTKWGNTFCVIDVIDAYCGDEDEARADCVRSYRDAIISGERPYLQLASAVDVRRELRGKDLVCWCRLDQACHADVLLELANAPALSAGSESKDQEKRP